jgi:pyroglutamyl-peptidase
LGRRLRFLLSGFEPFADDEINLSRELMNYIANLNLKDVDTIVLPVSFERAFPLLQAQIAKINPEVILMFGLNSKISKINIEKVAINFITARIPDNDGLQPKNQIINPQDASAYFASLDPFLVQSKLNELGTDCDISYSAGTYVCNYLYYQVLSNFNVPCVFLHIPHYINDNDFDKLVDAVKSLITKLKEE